MLKKVIVFLLCPALCFGDDLILKDGRRIAWKSVTDEGDTYSVEMKDGKKLTLKKSEVERLAVGSEEPARPLTGATFTMDPKRAVTVDLLPKAKTESTSGAWKTVGRVLTNTGENSARVTVSFDFDMPEEYDLILQVERGGGTGGFDVGIVSGDSTGAFHFDAFSAASSFFGMMSGQFGPKQDGQVFRTGKSRTVKVSVRKDAVLVQLDGKDYWKSRVDWKAVTLLGDIPTPERRKLFLVAAGGSWKVLALSLVSVK